MRPPGAIQVKPFSIFNTLARRVEEFQPLNPPVVTYYSCGPTVYLPQHLGNMRAYVFVDTLRRALELNGYDVRHVMNITDVGHMTSDADAGEDKIEKTARAEGKDAARGRGFLYRAIQARLRQAQYPAARAAAALPRDRPRRRHDRAHRAHRGARLRLRHAPRASTSTSKNGAGKAASAGFRARASTSSMPASGWNIRPTRKARMTSRYGCSISRII